MFAEKVRPHIEAVAFHCYEGDYKAPGALNQVNFVSFIRNPLAFQDNGALNQVNLCLFERNTLFPVSNIS